MTKNLIKANARDIAGLSRPDKGDFSASPYIDNTGRGILKVRNVAWEINDVYAGSGDLNAQRAENGGLTNAEIQRSLFAANQAIFDPSPFIPPSSWSTSVSISMPAGCSAGETITGHDGNQYVEMIDIKTGELVSYLGEYSCMNPDSDEFTSRQLSAVAEDNGDYTFNSAAELEIETPVTPALHFSGSAPIHTMGLNQDAPTAPWQIPHSQNDERKFELQA